MYSFLRRMWVSGEKKIVLENFFSLSFLQAANYVLPLITLPYLVRVLGPEKYGLIAFAQAFMQYFITITDYGFGWSAVRAVSINKENKAVLSEIFCSVMAIKFFFMLISLAIVAATIILVPRFREYWLLYIFTFGVVLDGVLYPGWFFQGVAQMKYSALFIGMAKAIFTVLIFFFIKHQEDYLFVPLLNAIGYLITGVLSLLFVVYKFEVKAVIPSMSRVMEQLKDGWHVFISFVSINLYTTTNTFLLGLFTNNTIVGYFAAGEKLIRIVTQMYQPLFKALYPYITKLVTESRERTIHALRKTIRLTLVSSMIIFLGVIIFAKPIAKLILGGKFAESIIIMRVLSPLVVVIPLAFIFANLGLLPFKLDKYFARIYISGGFINIGFLMVFILGLNLQGIGAALSNLLTEIILTVMMYRVLKKHGITVFQSIYIYKARSDS